MTAAPALTGRRPRPNTSATSRLQEGRRRHVCHRCWSRAWNNRRRPNARASGQAPPEGPAATRRPTELCCGHQGRITARRRAAGPPPRALRRDEHVLQGNGFDSPWRRVSESKLSPRGDGDPRRSCREQPIITASSSVDRRCRQPPATLRRGRRSGPAPRFLESPGRAPASAGAPSTRAVIRSPLWRRANRFLRRFRFSSSNSVALPGAGHGRSPGCRPTAVEDSAAAGRDRGPALPSSAVSNGRPRTSRPASGPPDVVGEVSPGGDFGAQVAGSVASVEHSSAARRLALRFVPVAAVKNRANRAKADQPDRLV